MSICKFTKPSKKKEPNDKIIFNDIYLFFKKNLKSNTFLCLFINQHYKREFIDLNK